MEINEAKKQLLANLQAQHDGIVGGGIRQKDGEPCIVVYVNAPDLQAFVPPHFANHTVETEVRPYARTG